MLTRLPLRSLGGILGVIGAVVGFVVCLLYSVFTVLGRVTGISSDSSHFLLGTLSALVAVGGSMVAVVSGIFGALLLLLAIIGFAFALGWWAILPALFLVPAMLLAFNNRALQRQSRQPVTP